MTEPSGEPPSMQQHATAKAEARARVEASTSGEGQQAPRAREPSRADHAQRGAPDDGPDDKGAASAKAEHDPADRRADASDAPRSKDGDPAPTPPPKSVFVVAGLVLAAALGWGAYAHWRDYRASQQTTSETLERTIEVRTTEAKRQDQPIPVTLPGQTAAYDNANIFPRATGYIGERMVDIGSRVKQGDLLVRIVAPDLDQQLAQAEAQIGQTRAARVQADAQVAQAEANVALAKVTFARTNQLTQQGYDTLQNRDNQQANVQSQQANVDNAKAGIGVADANIKAQQATIDRLKALAAFKDVRAPFDGVVTSRTVDTGDLLNADSATNAPMFTIARDDVVRVTVRVPQSEALGVVEGIDAEVTVAQMPGRVFKGKVSRNSEALLYSSRTLTTEVDVPNPDGALRSGLYVSVSLQVPRSQPSINVPAEALMFNQKGMQVATAENDHAKLRDVSIYRDHGTTVDLKAGLIGGERIILGPPATLADGAKIKEHRQEDEKKPDDKKPEPGSADGAKQANASSEKSSKD